MYRRLQSSGQGGFVPRDNPSRFAGVVLPLQRISERDCIYHSDFRRRQVPPKQVPSKSHFLAMRDSEKEGRTRAAGRVYQTRGMTYGYSQWHDQEDDRFGRTADLQGGETAL